MKFSGTLVLAAWMMLTANSGHAAQTPDTGKSDAANKPSTAPATAPVEEYKIGAQDILRIDVWKEAELTRTVPVRPDGKISLPLLNDVQAAGLTPTQLSSVITEGLKKFINSPQVTVTVSEINSRRVYVTGEVSKAGARRDEAIASAVSAPCE